MAYYSPQLPHVAVGHWEILDAQNQSVCHRRCYGRDWLRSMERLDQHTFRRPFAKSWSASNDDEHKWPRCCGACRFHIRVPLSCAATDWSALVRDHPTTHGYAADRGEAMKALAKAWRRKWTSEWRLAMRAASLNGVADIFRWLWQRLQEFLFRRFSSDISFIAAWKLWRCAKSTSRWSGAFTLAVM